MLGLVTRRIPSSAPSLLRRSIHNMDSATLYSLFSPPDGPPPPPVIVIDVRPDHEVRDIAAFNGGKSLTDYLGLGVRSTAEDTLKSIPLEDITNNTWLELSPSDFLDEYDFPHPLHANYASSDEATPLYVFSCKAGVRSKLAASIAKEKGVPNCWNFLPGAVGWDEYMTSR